MNKELDVTRLICLVALAFILSGCDKIQAALTSRAEKVNQAYPVSDDLLVAPGMLFAALQGDATLETTRDQYRQLLEKRATECTGGIGLGRFDTIDKGAARNDRLYGGGGNDIVNGLDGDDYIEGNAGNDSLHGGKGHDVLLGGAGNDTFASGEGHDLLCGGSGDDTYYFEGYVGIDMIRDADGVGRIAVGGAAGSRVLSGGKKLADNVWISDDRQITFTLIQDNLIIRFADDSGAAGFATIQAWKPGYLGITLSDEPAPSPAPSATFTGDFLKKQNADGTQYLIGADGNCIPDGSSPGAPDLITGSAAGSSRVATLNIENGFNQISHVNGGDLLLGRSSDDVLYGSEGNAIQLRTGQ